MTRRSSFLRFGLVAAATTALALAAAVPVSAHTGSLFTISGGDPLSFATISGTDATITEFGAPLVPGEITGIEIYDEVGYAVYYESIVTWDHTTGSVGTPVPLIAPTGYTVYGSVVALDSTTDGTLLAYAQLIADATPLVPVWWVVSIDPVTGQVTPEINVSFMAYPDSIATNPVTDVTYAFFHDSEGTHYVTLDLDAGTSGGVTVLTGIVGAIGPGYLGGADFDRNGTLWFNYFGNVGTVLASSTGEFSASAGAVVSGPVPDTYALINLAYDFGDAPAVVQPTAPVLPNMGVDASALVAGAVALFGAGLIALFIVRRRTA